ncbi:unnamed protein product [Moneuplotes crassus]|uniref:Protein kinase domain-containing protein n=1 Tax=Euplotes crassus TaxID=5936 RepID=A0AAD2D1P5_EUPCR|nr:unnamed protein product [Moneuplotes crassus]
MRQNSTCEDPGLHRSAVMEELSKSIHQKPMVIDEQKTKHKDEPKQIRKIKVFKTSNKSKFGANKSMEKTFKGKVNADDKIIRMNTKNHSKNLTKEISLIKDSSINPKDKAQRDYKEGKQEKGESMGPDCPPKATKEESVIATKKVDDSPKTKLKNLIDGKLESSNIFEMINEEEKGSNLSMRHRNTPSKITATKSDSDLKELLGFPLKVDSNMMVLGSLLTPQEIEELEHFDTLYYFNLDPQTIQKKLKRKEPIKYDDENLDYILKVGEHILYRYEIIDSLGKGSFGQVVKAFDHKHNRNVALKVIKNKQRFHIQGKVEVALLKKLNQTDSKDRKNVVKMIHSFIFRSHLCIVFELLSINLYEYIKMNNFRGCKMSIIKRFAIQILLALVHCKKNNVIHCDLKPENILLKKINKSGIKMIDFGSGCFSDKRIYTYIQSRFYRAPEIVLGLPYGREIDIWSFGCILCELYTGYPVFPCENELELLLSMQQYLGLPPRDLLEESSAREKFYDDDCKPLTLVTDRGKEKIPGSKTIESFLKTEDLAFIDFIKSCLTWDPSDRMDCEAAFKHPWIEEFLEKMKSPNNA